MARLPLILITGLVAVLTACGSQLSPEEVARATGSGGGAAAGDPLSGDSGVGVDGAAVDPAAGGDPAADEDVPEAAADPGADSGAGAAAAGGAAAAKGGKNSATGGVKAGGCSGFKNQVGITDKEITIANVADIGGPMPGIMEPAQQATRAYVEYFNSQGGEICGRKLKIVNFDSRVDAGADQQAWTKACEVAFAGVGSMSAFDSGGAAVAEKCGIPDIRTNDATPERQACKTCFGTLAIRTNLVPTHAAKVIAQRHPEAVKKAAMIYINMGAAIVNGKSYRAGYEKAGWTFVMEQSHDLAEFNYAPYVQQMKEKGAKGLIYFGAYFALVKLQQAMQQQGYKPDFIIDTSAQLYDQRYVDQAGAAGEDSYVATTFDLYDNRKNPEMQLYLSWLQQVKPGAVPSPWGVYAWSSARLFVEKATALGGNLTRAALVDEMEKVTSWTGKGLHTEMNIATGSTPPCGKVLQLKGGKWGQVSSGNYTCAPVVNTGIGG